VKWDDSGVLIETGSCLEYWTKTPSGAQRTDIYETMRRHLQINKIGLLYLLCDSPEEQVAQAVFIGLMFPVIITTFSSYSSRAFKYSL
jgi:hypothetical protein